MKHTLDDLRPEIELIRNSTVKNLVYRVFEEKVPRYFWDTDSSSSGYYHPTINGRPITLVEHVKSATRILYTLLSHPMIKGQFTQLQVDTMIASIILHDCAKKGLSDEGEPTTVHSHPLLASLLIPDKVTSEEYMIFSNIVENIVSHHGVWRWRQDDPTVLPEITNETQYYVHLADWIASRKIVHIDLDNNESIDYMRRNNQ